MMVGCAGDHTTVAHSFEERCKRVGVVKIVGGTVQVVAVFKGNCEVLVHSVEIRAETIKRTKIRRSGW